MAVPFLGANLAVIVIESLFYGIFFILFSTSIYLTIRRHQQSAGTTTRPLYTSPMFIASLLLFATVTAHWIIAVYRLYAAFITFRGGTEPVLFFADEAQITNVVKTGFLVATIFIGDTMIIYRLWIVYNYNKHVVLFPLCTLVGLLVSGIGITYQWTQYTLGENVFETAAGRWITSDCVFTFCTNVYCSVLIGWKVWNTNITARQYGGGSLMGVLTTIVESAALYTSWTIFFLVSYQSRSDIQFTVIDTWVPVAGIAFMMINVRVGLGWAQKASQDYSGGSRSYGGPSAQVRSEQSFAMRPVAVNITRIVNHEDELEPPLKTLSGSEFAQP